MGVSYSQPRFKVLLRSSHSRLTMHQNKLSNSIRLDEKGIVSLLQQGKEESAMIRCESLISSHNLLKSLEALQLVIGLLENRVAIITSSKGELPPSDLLSSLSTLIFCSKRVEIEDLTTLSKMLASKFSSKWVESQLDNGDSLCHPKIVKWMKTKTPKKKRVMKTLGKVAKSFDLDWKPGEYVRKGSDSDSDDSDDDDDGKSEEKKREEKEEEKKQHEEAKAAVINAMAMPLPVVLVAQPASSSISSSSSLVSPSSSSSFSPPPMSSISSSSSSPSPSITSTSLPLSSPSDLYPLTLTLHFLSISHLLLPNPNMDILLRCYLHGIPHDRAWKSSLSIDGGVERRLDHLVECAAPLAVKSPQDMVMVEIFSVNKGGGELFIGRGSYNAQYFITPTNGPDPSIHVVNVVEMKGMMVGEITVRTQFLPLKANTIAMAEPVYLHGNNQMSPGGNSMNMTAPPPSYDQVGGSGISSSSPENEMDEEEDDLAKRFKSL